MKKILLSSAFALVTLFSVNSAVAQNPKEQSPTYYTVVDGQIRICYDISGLGNVSTLPAELTFDATVTTLCYNRGRDAGPVPGQTKVNRGEKIPFEIAVTNGRARGCFTADYNPTCGSCPGGFSHSECTTSYSNVSLTIKYGSGKTRTFNATQQ